MTSGVGRRVSSAKMYRAGHASAFDFEQDKYAYQFSEKRAPTRPRFNFRTSAALALDVGTPGARAHPRRRTAADAGRDC
ncbi:hypothetical protein EMIT0158MI4_30612 [Burkholderia ambifaria]